jgi:His/Glu/Gln/Arg/opine family amino acid ABC transporter permease subunit
MDYRFSWGPIWDNIDLILYGLGTTIGLSALALVLAVGIGTAVGTAGASRSRSLRALSATYVESMRNVPLLIHMYFWYMALAVVQLPAFTCAVLGLAMYSGAYVAEVVRSGIRSVPNGQMAAALASGLTGLQARLFVVYPQAVKIIAPSFASLCSQLIKDSSLASVIAVAELTYQAGSIEGHTFRTFEVYITIALLYLALVTFVSQTVLFVFGERRRADTRGLADA